MFIQDTAQAAEQATVTQIAEALVNYGPLVATIIGGLVLSWLLFKVSKPVVSVVKGTSSVIKGSSPLMLASLAGFFGPMGASILGQEYGTQGTMACYIPMSLVIATSLITQVRRWVGVPSPGTLGKAIAHLDEAAKSVAQPDVALEIGKAKQILTPHA
ncbi:MAG: hypothetical protein ACXABY_20120 [Candidatus Thorarchaeota archaeon]|jgi:hypothetical protein